MISRVHRLLDTVKDLIPGDGANPVDAIRRQLTAPLTVALVGRSSSGKSTLLNAMVCNRVAATDETECTRVVTMYQDGQPPRVEVFGLDGQKSELPGVCHTDYGRPPEEIDYAMAYYPCDRLLKDYRVIDTPGLLTNTRQSELATRRALLGPTLLPKADVIVFVTKEVDLVPQEKAFLIEIRSTRRNTLFVMSCADRAGGDLFGSDPFAVAREVADKMAERHAGLAMAVIPVAGKLAEAGENGVKRPETEVIANLPAIRDVIDWELLLSDQSGTGTAELTRMQKLVGQYGIVHGREHAAKGSVHFSEWLSSRSGIQQVNTAIKTCFVQTADVLKARTAVEDIRSIARQSDRCPEILEALDKARNDDALHPIRELEAIELLTRSDPRHPLIKEFDEVGGIATDGGRLGLPVDAPAHHVRRAITDRVARCHERRMSATPAEQRALTVLLRSYLLLQRGAE